jgi:hypothetical protein
LITQLITVSNHPRAYFKQFQESAARRGYRLIVLGEGRAYHRNMERVRMLLDWIETCRGNTTHLFHCDAWDCWVQRPVEEAEQIWRECGHGLLISSGRHSHPLTTVDHWFPDKPGGYRYINAGVWIGEIEEVKHVLDWIWTNWGRENSDQGGYVRARMSGLFSMAIDHDNRLSFTVQTGDLDVVDGMVINKATGTTPCIVHGNSGQIRLVYEKLGIIGKG